jgi:type III restriction enzyme
VEALPQYKQGVHVPSDGGAWERLCNKMATGSGKTTVMGMIIAWQTLNAITYPKRSKDFSKAIFVVAPGLTVKERSIPATRTTCTTSSASAPTKACGRS